MRDVNRPRVGTFSLRVPAAVRMSPDEERFRARLGSGPLWVSAGAMYATSPEFLELAARCRRWYNLRQQAKRKSRTRAR